MSNQPNEPQKDNKISVAHSSLQTSENPSSQAKKATSTSSSKSTTADKNVNALTQWQSLSPWSMLSFIFGSAKAILSNGYAIIPVVYAGWQSGFDLQMGLLGFVVAILLLTIFSFIQWRTYRFKLSGQQLNIKRGLFFTRKDEIPLNKIQNIRYSQPFYFKPFKLGTLIVETAGSKDDEAHLSALDSTQASKLKQQLLQLAPQQLATNDAVDEISTKNTANSVNTPSDKTHNTIVVRNLKQLIQFGFYQNNLIWFAVIAGPIMGQIKWEQIVELPIIQQFWSAVVSYSGPSIALQAIAIMLTLLLVYCLFSIISIVAAVLKYHPYTLEKQQQTLQRSGGVISHQQDALAIRRVQLVHFSQPFLAKLLGLWTLYFKQVKGQEVEQKTTEHMLLPSVKTAEIAAILAQIPQLAGGTTNIPARYQAIALAWFLRRGLLMYIPALLILIFTGLNPISEVALLIATAVMGLTFLRYKQWGYVIEDEVLWQHSGLFGHHWKRIPYEKIQHVSITQTKGQQRSGHAYIEIGLASGSLTLPYIAEKDALFIAEKAMQTIKQDYRNWI
ncbi:PH domain-containing protein [Shewanella sp. 10N.286.48.A6]|uniref:PH domain-containing protein n=1 Tax=Shewanella sp. 10N.286.48.A6 TaxID=1880833 RepID=UPI000C85EAF2|nr:PH domain-containing protein [Shewanella sp. 10N.286.48.A6]